MTPIIVTAHFTPAADRRDALHAAFEEFIPRVHQERGCEYFALHEDADGLFLAIEKWSSEEALAEHDQGAPVAEFRKQLDHLVSTSPTVIRYRAIPLGDVSRGTL